MMMEQQANSEGDADQAVIYQSALYGTAADLGTEAGHAAAGFQASRSFFIIDKSRMVGERDTVEDAKVVYLPENEFRREVYHSRCSCLVGVADVYRNMTGEFPCCLTMAGCSYACQLLEPNYFMFLLGRPLEPSERVQATLQHISDIFHFYYHSPESVMKKSRRDWQTFAANMMFIFSRIREYVFRDPHSIAFMFSSLPYHQTGLRRKRSRLFLQASHILRTCQQQEPIIGGCIMYKTEIVCSQLSPLLMEKLQVIGGKGIELNTKSILEDNVAPETVWVLEVYLSQDEAEDVDDARRNLVLHRQAYDKMSPNRSLMESAVTFSSRFATTPAPSVSSPSPSSRGTRRKVGKSTFSGRRSQQRNVSVEPNTDTDSDYYNVTEALNSLTTHHSKMADTTSTHSTAATSTSTKSPERSVAYYNANKSTVTVLPDMTQAEKSATDRGVGGGGGVKEKERGRGTTAGRGAVAVSERRMPGLHKASEKRERLYDDPDVFPTAPRSQPSPSGRTKEPHLKEEPQKTTTSYSSSSNSIPATLSIPIPPKPRTGQTNSPNQAGTDVSSSNEDERFATPSPNFSFVPASIVDARRDRVTEDKTTGENGPQPPPPLPLRHVPADCSNSFKTADEMMSHSPPPPLPPPPFLPSSDHTSSPSSTSHTSAEKRTTGASSSIYNTMTPPPLRRRVVLPSPLKHTPPRHNNLEESDDFVDSEDLDRILSETEPTRSLRRDRMSQKLTIPDDRGSSPPPPPLPARNYELPGDRQPPLPPRSLPLSVVEVDQIGGDSGEFTVVEMAAVPPAVPPRNSSSPHRPVESEPTPNPPPPSPPLRTHSRRWKELPQTPDDTSTEEQTTVVEQVSDVTPPRPPPSLPPPHPLKDEETQERAIDESDATQDQLDVDRELPDRCESSSPHRALTQSQREAASEEEEEEDEEEEEEGGGHTFSGLQEIETERQLARELQERGWTREEVTDEMNSPGAGENNNQNPQNTENMSTENQSSVDPPRREKGTPLTGSLQDDDSTSVTSTTKTNTSDEEEGSDCEIMAGLKAATLRSLPRSTSTPNEARTNNSRGLVERSFAESLSIQSLTPERSEAPPSLSFTQLNTPEMTIQMSTAEKLRQMDDDAGREEEGEEGGGDGQSQMALLANNMARLHQTLGRQIQAPAAEPVPPKETWCLYVQKQLNTMLVLVAKEGLHENHPLLINMWKRLLPQLFALDQGLETLANQQPTKHGYNLALYQNTDKYCSVETKKALYKFRHAVRYTHLEYEKNPDLCQVTLLNAPKMVSQKVMGREVYYHHQKSSASDIFSATSIVTRTARQMLFQPLPERTHHFL